VSNVSLVILLLFAAYLSIAAIVAVPILQQQTGVFQEVSEENLRAQLDGEMNRFSLKYPDELGLSDPLRDIREIIESQTDIAESASLTTTLPISPTAPAAPRSLSTTSNAPTVWLIQDINRIDSDRARLTTQWTTLNSSVKDQLISAKEQAITAYRIGNLDRLGSEENFEHFIRINGWFNQQIATGDAALNRCRQAINTYESEAYRWNLAAAAELQTGNFYVGYAVSELYYHVTSSCNLDQLSIDNNPPQRPAFGSSLRGPFGPVASWLLQSESLSLALITGMLGFGLLGAAFASFVRERDDRKRGDPLVQDLPRFVIRGFSATIVVFLAVKGGLIIFASTDSEPNPYTLFFICLVAAVFSENIWAWAEETLLSKFRVNSEQKGDTEPDLLEVTADELVQADAEDVVADSDMPDGASDLAISDEHEGPEDEFESDDNVDDDNETL
jgi:hypothetical protein